MPYTNIPKPNSTTYTNVNAVGKQQYDQSSIIYDDPSVFYDGVNYTAYTNVSKPQGYGYLTWGDMGMPWYDAGWQWGSSTSLYTKISKPV